MVMIGRSEEMCLAKALYDNISDSCDELTFRRGDVLTVVEISPEGLDGWWLCELHDKRGICPGNRLRVIAGSGLNSQTNSRENSRPSSRNEGRPSSRETSRSTSRNDSRPNSRASSRASSRGEPRQTLAQENVYEIPPSDVRQHAGLTCPGGVYNRQCTSMDGTPPSEIQDEEGNWKRRSWHINPDQVITPTKVGSVYIYDQPNRQCQDYDVPASRYFPRVITVNNQLYGTPVLHPQYCPTSGPPGSPSCVPNGYVTMRHQPPPVPPNHPSFATYDTLPNRQPPEVTTHVTSPERKSSDSGMCIYDTPPARNSSDPTMCIYDTPPARNSSDPGMCIYDTPPARQQGVIPSFYNQQSDPGMVIYDRPPAPQSTRSFDMASNASTADDTYDVPSSHPIQVLSDRCSTTSGSIMSLPTDGSISGSSRASMDFYQQEIYDVPPATRKVAPPQRENPIHALDQAVKELYDIPSNIQHTNNSPTSVTSSDCVRDVCEDYDVPRADGAWISSGDSGIEAGKLDNIYDIPKDCDVYDIPNSAAIPVHALPRHGRIQGLRASGKVDVTAIYDIPPQVTRDSAISMHSDASSSQSIEDITNIHRLSICSMDSKGSDPPHYDELPVSLDGALELLLQRQQDIDSSCSKLMTLTNSISWNSSEQLEPKLYDIKLSCMYVKTAMQELVDFGEGTLANSRQTSDKRLTKILYQHLEPLQNAYQTICHCMKNLDKEKWQLDLLTKDTSVQKDMTQIIAIVKNVPHTSRTMSVFIQGNAKLLFKNNTPLYSTPKSRNVPDSCASGSSSEKPPLSTPVYSKVNKPMIRPKPNVVPRIAQPQRTSVQDRPLPAPPKPGFVTQNSTASNESLDNTCDESKDSKSWIPDYDYVSLVSPKNSPKNSPKRERKLETQKSDPGVMVPKTFREKLEKIQKKIHPPVKPQENALEMNNNDRLILQYYRPHTETNSITLVNAIDAFFESVDEQNSPRLFIAQSKHVVTAGHRLVFIGDTIHRNVVREDIRDKVLMCATELCNALKVVVEATKEAALKYPCVVAVQQMLDHVVEVSHCAHELKLVILQAAAL